MKNACQGQRCRLKADDTFIHQSLRASHQPPATSHRRRRKVIGVTPFAAPLRFDGAKKATITAAPPAGVAKESTAVRKFRVLLLPAGTVQTVTYNGRMAEVKF